MRAERVDLKKQRAAVDLPLEVGALIAVVDGICRCLGCRQQQAQDACDEKAFQRHVSISAIVMPAQAGIQ
jgi:hypothetical protein